MPETWILPNRRALALGLVVPAVLLLAAIGCLVAGQTLDSWLWRSLAIVLGVLSAILLGTLWRLIRQPRVAYQSGEVLVYGGLAEPLRVPVDIIECFFVGQAGGMIPDAQGKEAEVRTVIVRLAEAATEWHHRDVKAAFAHWGEGYVTIRGTWCEPITPDLLKRLNGRLAAIQRERKAQQAEAHA
jgi:hypothetical protein